MSLDYDFSLKNKLPNSNDWANTLFRLMNAHQNLQDDSIIAAVFMEAEIDSELLATIREIPVISPMIQEATASDLLQQKVIHYHRTRWP